MAITLVAVPAQDAYDGALRGILDALLCMAGFATLGRYLGLWSPGRAAHAGLSLDPGSGGSEVHPVVVAEQGQLVAHLRQP